MKKILLLGVYGMEVVECGGALLKNVLEGGQSYAGMMIAGEQSKPQIKLAAEKLKTDLKFLDYEMGNILPTKEQKIPMVHYIREINPDIIITQDPEHCISDLDPDRRMAMTVILESIALSSRNFEVLEGEKLSKIPTIYYMTPSHPNCLLDISDVWEEKQDALNMLESQLMFSAMFYENNYGSQLMETIIPEWNQLDSLLEKGKVSMQVFNQAYYLSNGSLEHSNLAFAETYRKEGLFEFNSLMV